MDRIDIYVDVENIEHTTLLAKNASPITSRYMDDQVLQAIERQYKRLGRSRHNAEMSNKEAKQWANLDAEARQLLNRGAKTLELSPRAYMRTLKVARTIADIEGSPDITTGHVAEAFQYRPTADSQS